MPIEAFGGPAAQVSGSDRSTARPKLMSTVISKLSEANPPLRFQGIQVFRVCKCYKAETTERNRCGIGTN